MKTHIQTLATAALVLVAAMTHALADSPVVSTALWIGNGTSDPAEPSSWECRDAGGAVIPSVCPTSDTVVTLPNGCVFNCPDGTAFSACEVVLPATVGADCDWRGVKAPFSGKLDLQGRKVKVSQLTGTAEFTDTSSGYQLLDAITSTGTQYIDTGYTPLKDDVVDAVLLAPKTQLGVYTTAFGAALVNAQGKLHNVYMVGLAYRNNGQYRYMRIDPSVAGSNAAFYEQVIELQCDGRDMRWKPKDAAMWTETLTASGIEGDCTSTMTIFGDNIGTGVEQLGAMTLYSFRITSNGETVRNLVPAKRFPDGSVGLLDLKDPNPETRFHGNLGTGDLSAGTVTNVIAGGELHVDVASGAIANTSVALTGSLKLVKDGAGTFVAQRTGQTYRGGMQVTGGQFALWNSGKDKSDFSPKSGTLGDRMDAFVDVDAGARFNIVGNYDFHTFTFRLNGGQLESNNRPISDVSGSEAFAQTHTDWSALGNIALTADSTYYVRYNMVQNKGMVDLGGHQLDVALLNDKTLMWCSGIQDGTFVVSNTQASAGWAYFKTIAPVDARTITLDMYAQFNLASELSVSNYVSHSPNDLTKGHQGAAALNVYGTFTPVTDFFYGCTLQNGSTLDLSARTGTWSVASRSTSGKTAVDFAKDATVVVVPPSVSRRKIVDWTDHVPANLDTVTFVLAPGHEGRLKKESDGLYLHRGLMLLFR